MAEPRIQYAQTEDGVSIAFFVMGHGPLLVYMPLPLMSHIEWELNSPVTRPWYERLAQRWTFVRYDGRGTGLSDRDVGDYSPDAMASDIEAVANSAGFERFSILAPSGAGIPAIKYVVGHPERVSHLVLWNGLLKGADRIPTPEIRAARTLVDQDWQLFTETQAHVWIGWSEPGRRLAEYLRESISPEAFQAIDSAHAKVDVTELLPNVEVPTLVLHGRRSVIPPADVPRALASHIPNARLAFFEGFSAGPSGGDTDTVFTAIDEFLGEGEEAAAGAEPLAPDDIHTILFTDVEGSTALTQRLGDAKARELLREHERMVREALKAQGGSEVKTMGDGFMASFSSATKALECAIVMQRAFAEHNKSAKEPIMVRVGLNAGEPIAEDEDLFGTAVNEAARITAVAKGGEILVANVVRELAKGKEFMFGDRGETALKGFDDPVRLFEVRWRVEG